MAKEKKLDEGYYSSKSSNPPAVFGDKRFKGKNLQERRAIQRDDSAQVPQQINQINPGTASLLNPAQQQQAPSFNTDLFKSIMESGQDEAKIREAALMTGKIQAAQDALKPGIRPPTGYGERSLSNIFSGIYGSPAGTGKIRGQDKDTRGPAPGVIEKTKGRAFGDEGQVYVPGRDESYAINTPEPYKKARSEFISEVGETGGIPTDFQRFIPRGSSLLSPGGAGTETYNADYGKDAPGQPQTLNEQLAALKSGQQTEPGPQQSARKGPPMTMEDFKAQQMIDEVLFAQQQGGAGGSLLSPTAQAATAPGEVPVEDEDPDFSPTKPPSSKRGQSKKNTSFMQRLLDQFHRSGTQTGSFGPGNSLLTRRR